MSDPGPRDYLLAPRDLLAANLASFEAAFCCTLGPKDARAMDKIIASNEFANYVSPASQRRTAICVAKAGERYHAFVAYKNTESPYATKPLAAIRALVSIIDRSKDLAVSNYSETVFLDLASAQLTQAISALRNVPVALAGRMASFTGVHLVTSDTPPLQIAYHWNERRTSATASIQLPEQVRSIRDGLRQAHKLASIAGPVK